MLQAAFAALGRQPPEAICLHCAQISNDWAVDRIERGPTANALVMITPNRDTQLDFTPNSADILTQWPSGSVLEARGGAYSEDAFRYFLALEKRRAERSGRSLLLLLVDIASDPASRVPTSQVADKVFSALRDCVRDVDFVGWYRFGLVAGAVLAQGADSPAGEASAQIADRVTVELSRALPGSAHSRFHVRVLQMRQQVQG